jgi:hypothetical protein
MGILDDLVKIGTHALAEGTKEIGKGVKDLSDALAEDMKEEAGEPRKPKRVPIEVTIKESTKEQTNGRS